MLGDDASSVVYAAFITNSESTSPMIMKHIYALLILFLTSMLATHATTRDAQEARLIAQQWWAEHGAGTQALTTNQATTATKQGMTWCVRRGNQFVLVGSDNALPCVMGYGTTQDKLMPAMLDLLLQQHTPTATRYPLDGTKWVPVSPLVQTKHSFTTPYNDLSPYYTDDEGTTSPNRCVPGCVAIAMEQVLTYYRRTYTLQDTLYGWQTPHYTIPNLLPGEQFDTRLILHAYDDPEGTSEERSEVARLMYALGVAAHMNWGTGASGANSVTLVDPLKRAFGLKYVHYLDSYKYDPVAYWNFLAREIACGRPVYYAGSSMSTEGHAFVIDGLDEDGLFHVNWGYGGAWDGYFRLDVLSLREPQSDRKDWVNNGFFCNQEAIAICPDNVTDNCPPDTLRRTGREVKIVKAELLDEPTTTCPSRVRLVVDNTSDTLLTTPFALIENLDTDTALWSQADWLAFTGTTLQPHQRDTLTVHLTFARKGSGWLRITPDGEQVIDSIGIDVADVGTPLIEADKPTIDFADAQTVVISQKIKNPSATERGANQFFFDLNDRGFKLQIRKSHHIYLSASADTMITQRFTDLTPGKEYTYKLRRGGSTIVQQTFTMPTAEGITPIYIGVGEMRPRYFTLDGRLIGSELPSGLRGVVIKHDGEMVKKMIVQ